MNCLEDITYIVNLWNILLLIKYRCRYAVSWVRLQNAVCHVV